MGRLRGWWSGWLSRCLGFESFVLRVGWDGLLGVLEIFDGGNGLVAAVFGEIAVVTGEETFLAVEVLVEGFEVFRAVAVGQGVELIES